jgi:midasin (ATPase involved in ribosome maturation)
MMDGKEIKFEDEKELELKWVELTDSVSSHASELAESLRTIIEPTIATRLQYVPIFANFKFMTTLFFQR